MWRLVGEVHLLNIHIEFNIIGINDSNLNLFKLLHLQYNIQEIEQTHVYEHIHSTSNNRIDFWTYGPFEGIYSFHSDAQAFVCHHECTFTYSFICRGCHLYVWVFFLHFVLI